MSRAINTIIALCLYLVTATNLDAKPCLVEKVRFKPLVLGFAGWTMPMTSYRDSAMVQIIDRLRTQGIKADVYPPEMWPEVAENLLSARAPQQPIVLVGFSMGAAAAVHVAQKLGAAGIPVRSIVVVEAWNPEAVPANVSEATHFYSTGWASLIKPTSENKNNVENIDLKNIIPDIQKASHTDMSRMVAVQNLVTDKIIEAGSRDDLADHAVGISKSSGRNTRNGDVSCSVRKTP